MKKLFLVVALLGFSTASRAECVALASSWISMICYSPARVTAVMNGNTYDFCGMSRATFDGWARASSPGSHYNSFIKGRYRCF